MRRIAQSVVLVLSFCLTGPVSATAKAGVEILPTHGRNVYRLAVAQERGEAADVLIVGSTYDNRVCVFDQDGTHRWDAAVGGFVFDLATGDLGKFQKPLHLVPFHFEDIHTLQFGTSDGIFEINDFHWFNFLGWLIQGYQEIVLFRIFEYRSADALQLVGSSNLKETVTRRLLQSRDNIPVDQG